MPVNYQNSIRFLGAAETVTGSKYLLSINEKKILIDCGLFQGLKNLREKNWRKLPLNVKDIDCVLLTHGHLDHVGFLPRLVKDGYKNPVYCTFPTADLAEIILFDSAHIQEEDAKHANTHNYTKHKPALPLYTIGDVKKTIPLLHGKNDDHWFDLGNEIKARFRKVAHIPGASFIEISWNDEYIVFSGDLGRPNDQMLYPPERPAHAHTLVVESTYGDRHHPDDLNIPRIREMISSTLQRGGSVIVPSFTVDRAQDFMYIFWQLKESNKIPDIPVYLDSPMGRKVTNLFTKYPEWHKLGTKTFADIYASVKMVHSFDQTEKIAHNKEPKIVIAGSGMMNGGRVLTYLKTHLGDARNTVVIPGFQAMGTRGRQIKEGAKEVKIHGKYYPVKAAVFDVQTMSSHADQDEILDWLSGIKNKPHQVFITHGEPHAAHTLRAKIQHEFKWNVCVPELFEEFEIY